MALEISVATRALMPEHLRNLKPYDAALSPCEINLSANENTYGVPSEVRRELCERLSQLDINRYPDALATELREQLAALYGLERDWVLAGNGGDELLFDMFLAFAGTGRRVVVSTPTFSIYRLYASMLNCDVVEIPRDPETQRSNYEALYEAARDAHLVVLCSPNNPTGELVERDAVVKLLDICPGLVLVDEAYAEFAPPESSCVPLLKEREHLLILRTFSKAYALAGARCGYVLAAPDLIAALASVRQTYSLNLITQTLALLVLEKRELFEPTIQSIIAERERLFEQLSALADQNPQLRVWQSQANFLLVRLPQATKIRERLRDEWSILVRDFSVEPGLADCLRISVGTPDENARVLEALTSLLKEYL